MSKTARTFVSKTVASPVGRLTLVASDTGLAAVLWENDSPRRVPLTVEGEDPNHPALLNEVATKVVMRNESQDQ